MKKVTMSRATKEFIPSNIYYPEYDNKGTDSNIPDGELSKEDREYVVQRFRKDQQENVAYARPAILRYNMEVEFNGIIACSPHFVGIFIKKSLTAEPKLSVIFHIFDISSLRIRKKHKVLLFCRLPQLNKKNPIVNCRIICSTAIVFAQILRRNYLISTCAFDQNRLCDFATALPDEFPPFQHFLSPSQQYQHTYYAFCSRLEIYYNHEIAEFYHDRIKYEDGVFDFGLLAHELEEQHLIPAILALYYVPYVHGIIVHKRNMPYIARRIAPLFSKSKGLRFVHLVRCGIDSGIDDIGREMAKNPKVPISYFNFSHNSLTSDGLEPLFQALKNHREPIFYFNIGRCNVTNLRTLFEAIDQNDAFQDIKYLYFNGNYSSTEDCDIFCSHLEKIYRNNQRIITSLGIGGDTNGIVHILQTLERYPQPIVELSFEGTRMHRESSEALLHYVKQATTLKILDLSYTMMDPGLIKDIVYELSKYERIKDISIKLNGNNLNREKLMIVATGFLYSDLNVWTSISLADNNLSAIELDFLISFLWRMPNLREIDISDNFERSMQGIGPIIRKININNFPNLRKFRFRGSPRGGGPAQQLYDVLDNLSQYSELEVLDLSDNNLGELGFQKIHKIITNNRNLKTLYIDGNAPASLPAINYVLKQIYDTESVDFCVFPIFDAMSAARHSPSQEEYFRSKTIVKKMRQQCSREINKHRYDHGLPSMVPFEAVKELGDVVDEIKVAMHKLLTRIEKAVHCGVCKDMGVTLPYLAQGEPIENGGRKEIVDIGQELLKYQTENLKIRIYEEGESKVDDFELPDPDFLHPKPVAQPAPESSSSSSSSPVVEEEEEEEAHEIKSDSDSGSGLNIDDIPGPKSSRDSKPKKSHHHKHKKHDDSDDEEEKPKKSDGEKKPKKSESDDKKPKRSDVNNDDKKPKKSESDDRKPRKSDVKNDDKKSRKSDVNGDGKKPKRSDVDGEKPKSPKKSKKGEEKSKTPKKSDEKPRKSDVDGEKPKSPKPRDDEVVVGADLQNDPRRGLARKPRRPPTRSSNASDSDEV